jgi:hypothetical protein
MLALAVRLQAEGRLDGSLSVQVALEANFRRRWLTAERKAH